MKTRIIAACALLPLLLAVVLFLPKIFTAIMVGLMAAVGAYELLWGTGLVKKPRLIVYTAIWAFLTGILSYFALPYVWVLVGILVFLCILYGEMFLTHGELPYEKLLVCLAGGILVPYLLTALVRLHCNENGRFLILIPFVLAFLSDTGAYFAGCLLGKHKLAPHISPKKTIEGVIGGVLGAIMGMVIYCFVLDRYFGFQANYLYAVIYGALGSAAAVVGDLSFSVIKRQVGIKDYGNLIPGHGGILDRFDSMTLVAPLTEALILLIPVVVK